jgi:hypothetical protein
MTTAPEGHTDPRQLNLWKQLLPGALGLIALAMLSGLGFAAWQANGPALLNALAANGLAWCL